MERPVVDAYLFKLGVWILNKVLIIDLWSLLSSFIHFISGTKLDYLNSGSTLLLELSDPYSVG